MSPLLTITGVSPDGITRWGRYSRHIRVVTFGAPNRQRRPGSSSVHQPRHRRSTPDRLWSGRRARHRAAQASHGSTLAVRADYKSDGLIRSVSALVVPAVGSGDTPTA